MDEDKPPRLKRRGLRSHRGDPLTLAGADAKLLWRTGEEATDMCGGELLSHALPCNKGGRAGGGGYAGELITSMSFSTLSGQDETHVPQLVHLA